MLDRRRWVAATALRIPTSPAALLRRLAGSMADRQDGQGLAEYALILAGIAIVSIVSVAFLGAGIADLFWAPINVEFGNILTDILGIGGDDATPRSLWMGCFHEGGGLDSYYAVPLDNGCTPGDLDTGERFDGDPGPSVDLIV